MNTKPISRALIIRKKWLDKILDHGKIWEMRSIPINVRGRIGLIEAGSGLIVGETNLVDSLPALAPDRFAKTIRLHQVDDFTLLEKWKYPWVLDSAERYKKPIPYPHPKGAVIWVNVDEYMRSNAA